MNWAIISVKYPESWKLLTDYHDSEENVGLIDHPTVWAWEGMELSRWELRHLFDFFDENFILITIGSQIITKPQRRKGRPKLQNGWIWTIVDQSRPVTDDTFRSKYPFCNSRTEAEEEAYNKAFEILEQKL